MTDKDYDEIQERFKARYRTKKGVSIIVNWLILALGVTSFLSGLSLEPSVRIFRFLTVDATLFTTFGAAACIMVNHVEVLAETELTRRSAYYIRLSAAVAESVIFIVVIFSQLPFFQEHLLIFDRYDSFVMHVLIPLLGMDSFLINDAPIGKLKPLQRIQGSWFVTCYAIIIIWLISAEKLPSELVPYFFLDYRTNGWGIFLAAFVFVYGCAYLMAWAISEWNRKLSWVWFRGIASKKSKE